jgi:hypothetical protein
VGLEEKCVSNVVECAQSTFSFAILWRSIWTRHAEVNAVAGEKINKGGVDKLGTIIDS